MWAASRIRDFYDLAKPGIIYGNLITVIGGFMLGLHLMKDRGNAYEIFAATIIGISLVIASAAAFNNYIDIDIDRVMARTKGRSLATGRISAGAAVTYATILGILGFFTLGYFVNMTTVFTAAIGFFFYVFPYSLWSKRQYPFGTVIGSISGAIPPVVGYAASSGRIDDSALLLFIILALWQMPHFFAIGIYRREEYRDAGVAIMPVVQGVKTAKIASLLYMIAFIGSVFLLGSVTAFGGGAGRTSYLIIAAVISASWLGYCLYGFIVKGAAAEYSWARLMFFLSLAVLVVLFAAITLISAVVLA